MYPRSCARSNCDTYYTLGNIGWWLSMQRQIARKSRTEVADAMGWPRGAIRAIEEGQRVPQASTVRTYLAVLADEPVSRMRRQPDMYTRFHREAVA